MENKFHSDLRRMMDDFVKTVYSETKSFPREEVYGLTSQLRRSSLSVILNYIEGYARHRKLVLKNFLEISYGSLKEAEYLIYFSHDQKYLQTDSYNKLKDLSNKIGAMLYGAINKI